MVIYGDPGALEVIITDLAPCPGHITQSCYFWTFLQFWSLVHAHRCCICTLDTPVPALSTSDVLHPLTSRQCCQHAWGGSRLEPQIRNARDRQLSPKAPTLMRTTGRAEVNFSVPQCCPLKNSCLCPRDHLLFDSCYHRDHNPLLPTRSCLASHCSPLTKGRVETSRAPGTKLHIWGPTTVPSWSAPIPR